MYNCSRWNISILMCSLFILLLPGNVVFGSVLSDPGIPDGEQIIWRWTSEDADPILSTVTWRVKERNGRSVYEITTDSGEQKQGKYVIDKSDLRLVWLNIVEMTEKGKSEITIDVRNNRECLIHDLEGKRKDKEIDGCPDGYNGIILPFSLRGYPFGRRREVELRITPPFQSGTPMWAWRMWKSYAKLLAEEKVTVPAGTFDCYKLEVAASGGLIRKVTSEYYFWYTKEHPHYFVKYQDKDAKSVTELIEIKPKRDASSPE